VLLAVLLLAFGYLLADQGSFARSYVRDQLGQQKITFAAADELTPEDTSWKPGSTCLVTYAGQLMETGKQAECYANYYIGMHLVTRAESAGYPGATYATLGGTRSELQADLAAAKEKGDTAGAAKIQEELDAATALRSTMQTGETLRGLLLTSYGFSIFGEKAVLASNIAFIAAGLMAVLSVAGFVHAFLTPREKMVFSNVQVGEKRAAAEPTVGG
jgi:hypothetical protein